MVWLLRHCPPAYQFLAFGTFNANKPDHWNAAWSRHGNQGFRATGDVPEIRAEVLRAVPRDTTILDVGCGVGEIMSLLRDANGCQCYGVDFAPSAIAAVLASGMQAKVAALPEIPYEDAKFDAVVCTETLEHVSDAKASLQSMWRVLKPGGLLVLTVPDGTVDEEGIHFHRFTRDRLRRLLQQRQFVVEELAQLGNQAGSCPSFLALARRPALTPGTAQSASASKAALPGYLLVLPWQLTVIGGVNTVVRGLYGAMQEGGSVRPSVLLNLWDPATMEPFPGYDLAAMRLRAPAPGGFLTLLKFLLAQPWTLIRLHRLIRERGVRAVNPCFPGLHSLSFALARRLFHVKLVLTFQGADVKFPLDARGMERRMWRYLLRNADHLVCCSHSLAQHLLAFDPVLAPRVSVIHNAIDAEAFVEGAKAFPINLEEPYALMTAIFEHRKGYKTLFEAWPAIQQRHPRLKLVVVGSGGANRDTILNWAKETQATVMEDLGVGAVSSLMSRAAVFLLPTEKEGFPLVLLEAGAHALPVVASAVDGIPELIDNEVHGLLIPPKDPSALAQAALRILDDGALAARLGNRLRERVRCEFSWRRAAEQYTELMHFSKELPLRKP